jgi:AcrR family transcriptional regulator
MTQPAPDGPATRDHTRTALVEVATQLLRDGGPAAVTTRAVAAAAGMQAPTIYRLFGDKDGLLDAVAEHAFGTYVFGKTSADQRLDPVADLRAAWDLHIEFGLANPTVYALLADPARASSPAVAAGMTVLQTRMHRVASTGRLRVSERRAVELMHAAGTGVLLTLIATPAEDRDPSLASAMFDAVLRTMLTDVPGVAGGDTAAAAVALRAASPDLTMFTTAERAVLTEWLDRIIAAPSRS